MKVYATKGDRTTVFNYTGMTESDAIKSAKETIRKLTKENFGKRLKGWKFKVK